MARTQALSELELYCGMATRHSYDQYEKHGTLFSKAVTAFRDDSVWTEKWVPDDFDVCDAASHPVWEQRFTGEQKLAWNHLQWALDYSAVAQGERQIIVLNNFAVKEYGAILPSVCELERRESFEETDHIEAFCVVLEGVRARYFKTRKEPLQSIPASGFSSETLNRLSRRAMGRVATYLLGSNFPTLFFLARGMKTHGFKPFENSIVTNDEGHPAIRMISHLHRLDESRHMATSLNLARLSSAVLEALPRDNKLLFRLAVQAAFPRGRSADYRLTYWRRVLNESTIYADIPKAERDALYAHMESRIGVNLQSLHERQARLTRQANKRIVEECGLSPDMKRLFVDVLRSDPAYAATVDAVRLDD
ncbi:MAG: hypothetical protein Q8P18_26745 [Pseudomonadota bacterium]|nr:hypothetical protein [Pseudomonadota bacterium]